MLQLQSEPPHKFQDAIASRFPRTNVEHVASLQLLVGATGLQTPQSTETANIPAIYHFSSEDSTRKLSVSADFFAFSCTKYKKWEAFRDEFTELFGLFNATYANTALRRVGLRYKDLIEREAVGLAGVPWKDLLNPIVAGVLASEEFFEAPLQPDDESRVQQAFQTALALDDCDVILQSALLRSGEAVPRHAFLIDTDFFHDSQSRPLSREGLHGILELLHNSADALFRACLKTRLHDALSPSPL